MKRTLLAVSAIFAFVGTASAADLKAPVYKAMAPAPAYSWTGFYLGVNAGFGVGQNPSTLNLPVALWANTFSLSPIGAIGGAQAGYNWQFGNWVLGVEADIQASGMRDNDTCILRCLTGLQSASVNQSLDWFGTARARIGYANGPVLSYYTGGFAFGGVKTTITETLAPFATTAFPFSDDTVTGWTLGSGVEAALGGNWTGKVEYLYLDLGSSSTSYVLGGIGHTSSTDVRSHIFRAGLNYRIGGTPAVAYPTANWTGLYIGANVGSGIARNESSFAFSAPLFTNETFVLTPRGFLGGGQVGFNWQASNIVFGLEADFQGSTQKDDDTCITQCQPPALPGLFARYDQTMPWFGTLRGRIGYAAGPALYYLTGGLAYGKVETTVTEQIVAVPPLSTSFSDTKTGWTIGGGVERPFNLFGLLPGNNWTMKTEYLYTDLGSVSGTYTFGGVARNFTSDVTSHVFRSGINYHFNAGPVIAKY